MTQQGSNAMLLHFTLELADGSVAESTYSSGKPALFRLGDNSLSAELEAQLVSLEKGDKRRFTLLPEHAFGKKNPDLVQFFRPRDFMQTGVPELGTVMLFTGPNGHEMAGVIQEIAGESITVDFNHPLAGQVVTFDIEVVDINPKTDESQQVHENSIS